MMIALWPELLARISGSALIVIPNECISNGWLIHRKIWYCTISAVLFQSIRFDDHGRAAFDRLLPPFPTNLISISLGCAMECNPFNRSQLNGIHETMIKRICSESDMKLDMPPFLKPRYSPRIRLRKKCPQMSSSQSASDYEWKVKYCPGHNSSFFANAPHPFQNAHQKMHICMFGARSRPLRNVSWNGKAWFVISSRQMTLRSLIYVSQCIP